MERKLDKVFEMVLVHEKHCVHVIIPDELTIMLVASTIPAIGLARLTSLELGANIRPVTLTLFQYQNSEYLAHFWKDVFFSSQP